MYDAAQNQLDHIFMRRSAAGDANALERLAQLDCAPAPIAPGLVAEVRGRLIAYVSLADGQVIADPFEHTTDVVAVLRLRAAQLRDADGAAARQGRAGHRLSARGPRDRTLGHTVDGSVLGSTSAR